MITKELVEITENPLEGIKMFINDEDVTDIQAIIEGPAGTPYEDGIFKMKLVLSKDFPSSPPQGFFLTKIFHPNVAKNGAICVNTLKRDWKPDHGIKHILLTVKCLLIYPNPESALNEEAGRLLLEQYEEYSRHAKMMTEIHAKPVKVTSKKPELSSSGQLDGDDDETETKKPAVEKGVSNGATGIASNSSDKRKKDKKKALKRL
jgi:ubiquitin-conjugating enzyme E2 S